jgi:small-conductance mechanosensitive channel
MAPRALCWKKTVPHWIQFVGPTHALQIFGIKLVGINAENGKKLLFSAVLIIVMMLLSKLLRTLAQGVGKRGERIAFWVRQAIHIVTAVILIVGLLSIWFDDPGRLATGAGILTAGLAFALQRVITSVAGYIVILNGHTFNVGDRIVMGGVRGDVIALGFTQTTIMEMGQPPPVQSADPAMWVKARQYTGRIVTVPNAKIFDEAIFNYTREFPYLWEEMSLPISYKDDQHVAEKILLDVAEKHTIPISRLGDGALEELERRYAMKRAEMKPRVYQRMTDNWLELTVRFIAEDHGVRDLKDAMTRDILAALDKAKIGIASATFEIVGLPKLRIENLSGGGHNQPVGAGRDPGGGGGAHRQTT